MSFRPKMSFFDGEIFVKKSFLKIQVFSSLFSFSKKIVVDFFRLNFYNPIKINTTQWAIHVFYENLRKQASIKKSCVKKCWFFLTSIISKNCCKKPKFVKKYSYFVLAEKRQKTNGFLRRKTCQNKILCFSYANLARKLSDFIKKSSARSWKAEKSAMKIELDKKRHFDPQFCCFYA